MNSEEIKPVAIAIIELLRIFFFKFYINFMEEFMAGLKKFLGFGYA